MIIDPTSEGDPRNVQRPAQETTPAGLIVPRGAIQKKHRVITAANWKQWRRTVRSMNELGIGIGPMHVGDKMNTGCHKPLLPVEKQLALECECSHWVIGAR